MTGVPASDNSRPRRRRIVAALGAVCVVALTGCGRVDFDQVRRDHVRQLAADLEHRTQRTLPQGQAVGLDDCIRIALANNLDVRAADVEARLAGLDRKIAFANFLPHIELSWDYRETSRAVLTRAGGQYMQTSDRGISTVGLAAQQPIFMPQTWFLYSAYQKGEQISGLVRQRTRQLIALRAIALYYACLSQDEAAGYLRQSLSEGQALLDETLALEREGLVLPAQRQAIEAMVLERRRALDDNDRARREARADLLETMGLSPLATIELAAESPIEPPEGDVADQVLEAMLHRPELHVADRAIEIRKDEVRMAIADFLPVVRAFTSYDHSSNSYLKYANTWAYGASAVLSAFDGFANIYRYRAARERQEASFIEREQACLTVMLEVVKARRQLDDADQALAVASLRRQAAAGRLRNIESQWREGLIETSSRSAALAERDGAVAAEAVARYRRQVAAATLADVMGVTKEWSEQ